MTNTFTARFTDCPHARELPLLHSAGHVNCYVCQPELRDKPIKGKCSPECTEKEGAAMSDGANLGKCAYCTYEFKSKDESFLVVEDTKSTGNIGASSHTICKDAAACEERKRNKFAESSSRPTK